MTDTELSEWLHANRPGHAWHVIDWDGTLIGMPMQDGVMYYLRASDPPDTAADHVVHVCCGPHVA